MALRLRQSRCTRTGLKDCPYFRLPDMEVAVTVPSFGSGRVMPVPAIGGRRLLHQFHRDPSAFRSRAIVKEKQFDMSTVGVLDRDDLEIVRGIEDQASIDELVKKLRDALGHFKSMRQRLGVDDRRPSPTELQNSLQEADGDEEIHVVFP